MAVSRRSGSATGKKLFYIALDGRLMAGWGTFLCILVQCHLMLTEWLVKASVTA